MNVLGLDLGTATGWCWWSDTECKLGTWILSTPKEVRDWGKQRLTRRNDPRIHRLCTNVRSYFLRPAKPDFIVFEDVQFASSTLQVQLWSALRAAVWLGADPICKIECVDVSTLKKFGCGHGGGTKEMMLHAARQICPGIVGDDNAIDAWHLARWARLNLSRA